MRKMSAVGAFLPHRAVARRRRDGGDARQAEVGPEQAGADHAVMRHDDQAVDLLVAVIGEREHRPVVAALARAHLDAAHDAVGAGRGRNLDAVGFGVLPFGGGGEVDRRGVEADVDGFDRVRARAPPSRAAASAMRRLAARMTRSIRQPPAAAAAADRAPPAVPIAQSSDLRRLRRSRRPADCADFRGLSKLRRARVDPIRPQTVSTILPICALDSIRAWAAAASRSGKVCRSPA